MIWNLFGGKPTAEKLIEQAFRVIEDRAPQWIHDASMEDPQATEISVPLKLKLTQKDWDDMERARAKKVNAISPVAHDDLIQRYPFLETLTTWQRVSSLYGSSHISTRLAFVKPPDTDTDIEITFSSDNDMTLRRILDRILADSRAYSNENDL